MPLDEYTDVGPLCIIGTGSEIAAIAKTVLKSFLHELNFKASGVPCSPPCAPHRPNTLLRSPPAGHLLPHFALNSRLPSLVPSEPARPFSLPLNPLLSEPLDIDENVGIVANEAWLISHYRAFAPEALGEAAARNADPALPDLCVRGVG